VERLNQAVRQALASESVRSLYDRLSTQVPDDLSPEALTRLQTKDSEKWRALLSAQ
jgi:tripartite-type tricarboxylate transporter receptor subunit TctC